MSESNFIQKVGAACNKKEDLYQKSKTRYAVRSIFAGGFLTLSTAVGAVAADLLNTFVPGSGRFLFPFIFAWGLVYLLFLNAELTTSNMMYLTAGTYLKKINWKKALEILLYCTFFNLIGALIVLSQIISFNDVIKFCIVACVCRINTCQSCCCILITRGVALPCTCKMSLFQNSYIVLQ